MKNTTVKLSEFLKENNAYEKFVENFDKKFYDMTLMVSNNKKSVNIHNSFKWDNNYEYWTSLFLKWDVNTIKDYDMDWLCGDNKEQNHTKHTKNNFKDYDLFGNFNGEILKEVDGYYIGWADVPGYGLASCKWSKSGTTNYACYELTPITKEWYEIDTHWILTKENNTDFRPRRKFKIAWTEDMKNSLISTGWRFATPDEVKHLKLKD